MVKNISTIIINASRERVWATITLPELVKLWQYGSDLITTWQIDSTIRFKTEWQGTIFEQWGKVLAVKPFEVVSYSLFAPRPGLEDKPENYFVMHYKLKVFGTQTQLEIIQEDSRLNAVQDAPQGEENPVLQALKQVAEN